MRKEAKDPTFQSVSDLKTKPDEEERDRGQLARATLNVAYGRRSVREGWPRTFLPFSAF